VEEIKWIFSYKTKTYDDFLYFLRYYCKILELSAFHYDELRAGKLNMNKINFSSSTRRRRAAMECEKKCLYGKY